MVAVERFAWPDGQPDRFWLDQEHLVCHLILELSDGRTKIKINILFAYGGRRNE